eukprot:6202132-Pleurochrysis_carterae.AAC.1
MHDANAERIKLQGNELARMAVFAIIKSQARGNSERRGKLTTTEIAPREAIRHLPLGNSLASTTRKFEVRRASTFPMPASSMPVTVSSSPITDMS